MVFLRQGPLCHQFSSVQCLDRLDRLGDMTDDSVEIFFRVFSARQGCPLLDVVHPVFTLLTKASATRQGARKDDFGESVVACGMPEPWTFPSLDSCQKRFLWTHKEVDLAPHPVIDFVFQVGAAEKCPKSLGF